jgi:hypothetical protein
MQKTIFGAMVVALMLPVAARSSTVPDIAHAHAEEFDVIKTTVIDILPLARSACAVFSYDGTQLAYIQNGTPRRLVILSLPSLVRRRIIDLPGAIGTISWSRDGARILGIGEGARGFIISIATAQIVPLGVIDAMGQVIWADDRTVYFIQSEQIARSVRFDLETFGRSPISEPGSESATVARLRQTPLDHPFVRLRIIPVSLENGVTDNAVAAVNLDDSFTRVLVPHILSDGAQEWRPPSFSPDAKYAVVQYEAQLRLFTMGSRPRPQLGIKAVIAPLPDNISPSEVTELRASLLRGEVVWADVYRPRINPLNKRTIGYEGKAKGWVRITRIDSKGELAAYFVRELSGSPETGDVLRHFRADRQYGQTPFWSVSALVGDVMDSPPVAMEEPASKVEPTNAEPDKVVLDAFDAYTLGNSTRVDALMSREGLQNAHTFCSGGTAAGCLKRNYGAYGALISRSATIISISKSDGLARVRIVSNWGGIPQRVKMPKL